MYPVEIGLGFFFFHIRTVHLDIIKVFIYLPTDATVSCLKKKNIKIYIKIYTKTAATCFGDTVTPPWCIFFGVYMLPPSILTSSAQAISWCVPFSFKLWRANRFGYCDFTVDFCMWWVWEAHMVRKISELRTASLMRQRVFLFVTAAMFRQQGVRPWWEFDRPHLLFLTH